MSTRVIFLEIPKPPIERAACFAVARLVEQGQRVLLHAEGDQQAQSLDELLWSFDPDSFITHCCVEAGPVDPTLSEAVVIASGEASWPVATAAVLAAPAAYEWCESFDTVVDFAVTYDPVLLEASRARFRDWRERGFAPEYRDRSGRR